MSPSGANIDLKLPSWKGLEEISGKGRHFSLMQGQGKELGAAFHGAKTQTG